MRDGYDIAALIALDTFLAQSSPQVRIVLRAGIVSGYRCVGHPLITENYIAVQIGIIRRVGVLVGIEGGETAVAAVCAIFSTIASV